MAQNQCHAHHCWDSQVRHPQAAAHLRNFAITRNTESGICQKKAAHGSSFQKVTLGTHPTKERQSNTEGLWPWQREANLAAQSSVPNSTKKKPRQDQWDPRRRLATQTLDRCSNGGPSTQRIGWNCNVCSTESISSLRILVWRSELQQEAGQQTTPQGTPHSDQLHHTRQGRSGSQLQRSSYRQVTAQSALLLAQRRQVGNTNPRHSCLTRETTPCLRCHATSCCSPSLQTEEQRSEEISRASQTSAVPRGTKVHVQ